MEAQARTTGWFRPQAAFALRGYTVSSPFRGGFGRTVQITGTSSRYFWLVAFTASASQARRNARSDPYGIPTRRNVVFDIESIGLQPRDMPIVQCLRS